MIEIESEHAHYAYAVCGGCSNRVKLVLLSGEEMTASEKELARRTIEASGWFWFGDRRVHTKDMHLCPSCVAAVQATLVKES